MLETRRADYKVTRFFNQEMVTSFIDNFQVCDLPVMRTRNTDSEFPNTVTTVTSSKEKTFSSEWLITVRGEGGRLRQYGHPVRHDPS